MCSRTVLQLHTYNNGKVYVTIEYLGITASHFCWLNELPILAIDCVFAAVEPGHLVVEDPCEGVGDGGWAGLQLLSEGQGEGLLFGRRHNGGGGRALPAAAGHGGGQHLCNI